MRLFNNNMSSCRFRGTMRKPASFLTSDQRAELLKILRQRKSAALVACRANALLLLDDGKSTGFVARALFLDPDTVRVWLREFRATGLASVDLAAYPEREGKLNRDQEAALKALFRDNPPRDTNEVREVIFRFHGVDYSRAGAIKLMHRLGFDYVKPESLPRQADRGAQEAFIRHYEQLMCGMFPDETVVFADAVHPEYQSRPAHGWFIRSDKPAIRSTTGRRRLNLHGALNLETMKLTMVEGEKINAETSLRLLQKLERAYPDSRVVHVCLDNARYHHAKMLKPFLERPECRIRLHFLPPYAPHLNPIERLWGVMHRHVTHNRFHSDFRQFTEAIFAFFNETLPKEWETIADVVTDNFRVITHDDHRIIG